MELWRTKLAAGEADAAWDLFIGEHERLIFSAIRRTIDNEEDVFDVFAHVCQTLSADQLARVKRYTERHAGSARFTTWLVTVVHNLAIDWLRQRDGRRRATVPAGLSQVQQQIFQHLFVDHRSHVDTYELICACTGAPPFRSFGEFLRAVAETYRVLEKARNDGVMHYLGARQFSEQVESAAGDRFDGGELHQNIAGALDSLPADERLAVQLFVVDELPAAEVARMVGWPNAKTVYNRVYRALNGLRARLELQGITPADFHI